MRVYCFKKLEDCKQDKFKLNKSRVIALGLLGTTLLTGCNSYSDNGFDKDTKVVIMNDKEDFYVSVDQWELYDNGQLRIDVSNGSSFDTTLGDAIIVDGNNQDMEANLAIETMYDDSSYVSDVKELECLAENKMISYNDKESRDEQTVWLQSENGDMVLTSQSLWNFLKEENKELLDELSVKENSQYVSDIRFNYALKVIDGNVTIIPFYGQLYNLDNLTAYNSVELILPDNTAITTTVSDTLFVNNITDINRLASLFVGKDGVVTNIEDYLDYSPSSNAFTLEIGGRNYPYAILDAEKVSDAFNIAQWVNGGDTMELYFQDGSGLLTSNTNVTLVDPATEGIEQVFADAFSGKPVIDNKQKCK